MSMCTFLDTFKKCPYIKRLTNEFVSLSVSFYGRRARLRAHVHMTRCVMYKTNSHQSTCSRMKLLSDKGSSSDSGSWSESGVHVYNGRRVGGRALIFMVGP